MTGNFLERSLSTPGVGSLSSAQRDSSPFRENQNNTSRASQEVFTTLRPLSQRAHQADGRTCQLVQAKDNEVYFQVEQKGETI